MNRYRRTVKTPVGPLELLASEGALVGCYYEGHHPAPRIEGPVIQEKVGMRHDLLDAAERELREYFAGARDAFTIPLRPSGTPFQQRVWHCLANIAFGAVRSYGELAHDVGSPRAVRAVGSANAKNPLSLFLPCHRVIGADGSLRGYAGGEDKKAWLLSHERSC